MDNHVDGDAIAPDRAALYRLPKVEAARSLVFQQDAPRFPFDGNRLKPARQTGQTEMESTTPGEKWQGRGKGTLGGWKNLRNRRPFNAADIDPLLGHGDQRLNPGFDGGQSLRQRGSLAIGCDHQE